MKYSFDSVLHCSFTFTIEAKSYEEAVQKAREISNETRTKTAYKFPDFPDVCFGDFDTHLCYVEETDSDDVSYCHHGCIDEWV